METFLEIVYALVALFIILVVLIQGGNQGGVGAAFGSGASQTMFGSAGATSFLTTMTTWLAVGFFVITFGLAWSARERAEQLGTIGIPELDAEVPAALEIPTDDALLQIPVDDDVPALGADAVPADGSDVPVLDAAEDVPVAGAASEGGGR